MSHDHAVVQMSPIGTVRQSEGMFRLEILEPYRPALKGLGEFSHVIVIWWAHQHDNPADRAVMQTELPYAPGTVAGMFACRSPQRPNDEWAPFSASHSASELAHSWHAVHSTIGGNPAGGHSTQPSSQARRLQ